MSWRIGWRNLRRHRWRSMLTAGGVAAAVALLVWMGAMLEAFSAQMVDNVLGAQMGHLQIEDARYVERSMLQLALPVDEETLGTLRELPGVTRIQPRLTTFGLLGGEKRSATAMLVGVDPEVERGLAEGVERGSWITPREEVVTQGAIEVVLGRGLARQLDAEIGDERVLLTSAADGSSGDALVVVVGVLQSGSAELDRQGVWLRRRDLGWLIALEDRAHQLGVSLARDAELAEAADGVRRALGEELGGAPVSVRTWKEVLPSLDQMLELSGGSMGIIYFIMYLLAGLGLLNAQRMSALERKRELGVLLALGMTPGRLTRLLLAETLVLTALGALLGALLGGGAALYHSMYGFDMGTGESFSYMGLSIDPLIYFDFSPSMLVPPIVVVMGVGAVCGLWPALSSARLQPVQAISGRAS